MKGAQGTERNSNLNYTLTGLIGITFRPFRTSAIAFGLMLIGLVYMGLSHDFQLSKLGVGEGAEVIINLVIDVSVFMVALTALAGAISRLTDDGGENDVIKAIRLMYDKSR